MIFLTRYVVDVQLYRLIGSKWSHENLFFSANFQSYQEDQKHRGLSSVIFDADTDDRSNFSTDGAFHSFRKHRDFFYVILREYEERKHDPSMTIVI